MRIDNLNELNKKDDVQYKARNMYFDYVEPNGQFDKKQEIYQVWSYSTIVGYYNKTTHYAIFTNHKYSKTTTKQITMLCNENKLNHDFIDKTFVNVSTYDDINEIIDLLS